MTATLSVSEIYVSLQGEGLRAGRPCTLVRLAGCNLRCTWCDTRYAYQGGQNMTAEQVAGAVRRLTCRLVMVTGGEPLLQPATPELVARLCDDGLEVLVQTNGSQDIGVLDERAGRCVDVKCPLSGSADAMLWSNLDRLRPQDEAKFVLAGREDYEYAVRIINDRRLPGRCGVVLTPAHGLLVPAQLAEWIIADRLDARLGLQLHKLLWPLAQRGV